jgi:hypothetical protein
MELRLVTDFAGAIMEARHICKELESTKGYGVDITQHIFPIKGDRLGVEWRVRGFQRIPHGGKGSTFFHDQFSEYTAAEQYADELFAMLGDRYA